LLFVLVVGLLSAGCSPSGQSLPGFTAEGATEQREIEAGILGTPSGERMNEYHLALTAEPHHAGTPANEELAGYIAERLRDFGFDSVYTARYEVLLPYPVEREVTLVAPERYELRLAEPALPGDPDTEKEGVLPTFNAYSADGDITAEVVYVNYGIPEDYRVLDSLGVSVEGRIVLARYGHSWRGIKPRLAAEHGAVGALIYSDPEDDGFVKGDTLPQGKWRPSQGVQRGSVMDMPLYPGDPQTPFEPSVEGTERVPLEEVPTLQKIPVQPISYGDAEPILRALGGAQVPEEWQGGLPFDYHVGSGPARVHMRLRFDWSVRPIVDVFGLLLGDEEPDTWIMAGGHRDAWTFGGRDPISGAVSLLETARALAEQARAGHRLRRTVAIASWDAEEWGLIGSTEWGEQHDTELPGKVAVYLNRESYHQGNFEASGSHALQPLVNDVARAVAFPRAADTTVYEHWVAQTQETDGEDEAEEPSMPPLVQENGRTDVRVGALGSGSDYTVFLDHLGIPALNMGFSGPNGIYHSRYDTHHYFTTFGDPGFVTGERLAEVVGLFLARMANARILPFDYRATAETVGRYLDELEAQAREEGPAMDLSGLRAANEEFAAAADALHDAVAGTLESENPDPAAVDALNGLMLDIERGFLSDEGLPGRPWFRHQLYAPGYYTGYGVKTLPGVREAMENGDAGEAAAMAQRLEASLRSVSAHVRQVLTGLGTSPSGP
jgi:N-acetylated-alpha-linked acidic dipeptidase